MPRKRRRRFTFKFYLFLIVLLGLVGFGVYSAVGGTGQRVGVIEAGNIGNVYTAGAVVVRNETLTDAEGVTNVRYFADEGGLVFKGNKIAEVYSAGFSQTDVNKLLNVRAQIKQYHKTLRESAYADTQLDLMEARILDAAREIEILVHGKERGNLLNLERQMQSALTNRQTHLKNKHVGDQNLTSLYENESTLQKKIDNWTDTHLADSDCIVSFYTDGYENVLQAENFDAISAQTVRSILAGEVPEQTASQRGRTAVFREVRPNGWYLLLLTNDVNWQPKDGQTYKIRLAGFDDHIVEGVVTSSALSGTEQVIRLAITGDVRPVLNIRATTAEVGEASVSGLRVPLSALYEQSGQKGVVLTDNGGTFVPVTVIRQDNTYAIIESMVPAALYEGQRIRLF